MNQEWDKKTALNKASRFCAYQERSAEEVRKKLSDRISDPARIEEIIVYLIEEGFLNEERFTHAFVTGKYLQKKWGRIKIRYALNHHRISEETVNRVLADVVNEEEYLNMAFQLLQKKVAQLGRRAPLEIKGKVFNFLASKGFEQDVIYAAWRQSDFDV